MTENNYVIKEDPSKHETLNQYWADVGPAAQGGPPTKTGDLACVG